MRCYWPNFALPNARKTRAQSVLGSQPRMSPNKSPFSSQSEAVPASNLACVVWAPLTRCEWRCGSAPTRGAPRLRWAATKGTTETTRSSSTEAAAAPASAVAQPDTLPEETTGAATHADAAAAEQADATADDATADATAAAHGDSPPDAPGSPPAPRSLFDHLGYDEFREVVDWLDGEDLLLLRDSGVINSPHSGLIKKWTSRWTRNAALQSAFAFLEPGDLGTVVAAFFVSDVALASAAHAASTAALRAGGRRRVPLAATDIITAV
jgi:hypothetical protein